MFYFFNMKAIRLGLVVGAAARGPVVLQCLPALSRLPVRPPLAQASTPWGGDPPDEIVKMKKKFQHKTYEL